jgi:hypothetical protein
LSQIPSDGNGEDDDYEVLGAADDDDGDDYGGEGADDDDVGGDDDGDGDGNGGDDGDYEPGLLDLAASPSHSPRAKLRYFVEEEAAKSSKPGS